MTEDMHQHRRQGDHDFGDPPQRRMETAAESVLAKFLSRVVMPGMLVLVVLPVTGYLVMRAINSFDRLVEKVGVIDTRTEVMNERQNSFIVGTLQEHSEHLKKVDAKDVDQDRRLERLERAVPTP